MTYSIVALDRETGQLGVAVQSHYFGVGSVVPWAEAGVGAVATQAMVERSYGPLGIERMRAGEPARAALDGLLAADDQSAIRQVSFVDASGSVAVHTGERCIAEASHIAGDAWAVQANMMTTTGVPEAMAAAFEAARAESLVWRLLAALDAAEAAGGDIRGRQSAALLLVDGSGQSGPLGMAMFDVRVEDHQEPLVELRRLVRIRHAYVTGDPDVAELGANPEVAFWRGVALAVSGDIDAARPFVRRAVDVGPQWADLLRRLPPTGLIPEDGDVVRALLDDVSD